MAGGQVRGLRAAGTVPIRGAADGPQIGLVHRQRYDDWSLPKGKLRPDETWPVAAVRETLEETGLSVRLGMPVGSATYEVRGRRKEVRYWVAEQVGEPGRRIGDEVDDLGWFPLDRALQLLRHDTERAVATAAVQAELTVPLVVARHAKALPRKRWKAADTDRPLAKRGSDQALRLAGLLSAWSPARVVSSPALRCLDSVTPYAAMSGSTVELEPLLSEEGHELDTAAVVRLVAEVVAAMRREAASLAEGRRTDGTGADRRRAAMTAAESRRDARSVPSTASGIVLCSHRPVLPTIADALDIPLAADDRDEALPPAGCWVLHVPVDGPVSVEEHVI